MLLRIAAETLEAHGNIGINKTPKTQLLTTISKEINAGKCILCISSIKYNHLGKYKELIAKFDIHASKNYRMRGMGSS